MTAFRRTLALLLAAALVALAGAGLVSAGATSVPALAGKTYSGKDNGRTVKVGKGKVLYVSLNAASGTPYEWVVVKGKHTSKFKIVSRTTTSLNPGVPGGVYRTTWTIKGKKKGTATFKVVLRNVVDKKDVARRFTLHVKVTR